MKKIRKKIMAFILATLIIFAFFGNMTIESMAAPSVPSITYQGHVQDYGWMATVKNGATAGTTGQSKRLEGIKINLKSGKKSMVTYRAHVANIGWQSWKTSGQLAGTTGKSLSIEAVQIKLTGAYSNKYDIYYRVHVQGIGWLGWAKNGAVAGSTGAARRTEAIQIKLVKKGTVVSGSGRADITKTPLTYKGYVQKNGWMKTVSEGVTAGTTGQSKRMEALVINLKDYNGQSAVKYSCHVAGVGWQNWKKSGQMGGTTGKSRSIEAVKIQLTGTLSKYYDVYYRLHVAGYGWLGWAHNGGLAGTTGGGIRAEAIQIRLVAKGLSFDTGGKAYINVLNTTKSIHLTHHMSGSLDQRSYRLYGDNGENWGCCATAYATGLSVVTRRNYNPESFWRNQTTYYDQGHVNSYTGYNATTIYNNLLAGKPTMVHYKYYKGYGTSEHWVLVIGVRGGANKDNIQYSDFTVIDPWGGTEKPLSSVSYFSSTYGMGMKTFY